MNTYNECITMEAMDTLGEMGDFVTHEVGMPLRKFWPFFIASSIAPYIEKGSPFFILGKTGIELALLVCEQVGIEVPENIPLTAIEQIEEGQPDTSTLLARSREFWCGWILAYFQRRTEYTFKQINEALPIEQVERMYWAYHQMSEERFVEDAQAIIQNHRFEHGLKRQRTVVGLSQSQLAQRSGVSLRAIQQYEQGAKDIAKASYDKVFRLAQALHCSPEDLIDARSCYEYAFVELPRTESRRLV